MQSTSYTCLKTDEIAPEMPFFCCLQMNPKATVSRENRVILKQPLQINLHLAHEMPKAEPKLQFSYSKGQQLRSTLKLILLDFSQMLCLFS